VTSEWLPVAALAAGVVGTIGGQGLTGWLAWKREQGARSAERDVARDAFQRETLLEIQGAVLDVLRASSQLHINHKRVYRGTGKYARASDPEEMAEKQREAMARASQLRQRVLDDSLRTSIRELQELATEATGPPLLTLSNEDAARRADETFIKIAHDQAAFQEQLGVVLRGLL